MSPRVRKHVYRAGNPLMHVTSNNIFSTTAMKRILIEVLT